MGTLDQWIHPTLCPRSPCTDCEAWRHISALSRSEITRVSLPIIAFSGPNRCSRTHIITLSLTPAKLREFAHMKVVTPSWLTDSVDHGALLPWTDYKYIVNGRNESAQGITATQTVLPVQGPQPQASSSRLPPMPPAAPAKAKSTPAYATHTSNPHAIHAMANPQWAAAHTSVAPNFVEGYYKNSRLHHLSMWKAELRTLVGEAKRKAREAENNGGGGSLAPTTGPDTSMDTGVSMRNAGLVLRSPTKKSPFKGKGKATTASGERVIFHCDFDSFFVAAGLLSRPQYRGKPVVVCHSQEGGASSTSEVASASYEARKFGIKGGMSLQQAKKLCPAVVTIPYEFEVYAFLFLSPVSYVLMFCFT